jgi:NCAIR mutase (PurE)-related protein
MTEETLQSLLMDLAQGKRSASQVLDLLKTGPFSAREALDAIPDHHRALRTGFTEVIFGENKDAEQIISIAVSLGQSTPILVTRINAEKIARIEESFPGTRANPIARTAVIRPPHEKRLTLGQIEQGSNPFVLIVTAGTSDLAVAQEASEVCIARGVPYALISDAGVAGLHRITSRTWLLQKASAIVVCAGMEGALPGVIAGLCGKPVFAVPTSVGYGANLGGFAALLTMLNSCGSGVSVVNIDAGFSAAFSACAVIQEIARFSSPAQG